jgi:hypothetical protein
MLLCLIPVKESSLLYSREKHLRNQLNGFLAHDLGLPEADYYGAMSLDSFMKLKSALSNINNIFTLKVGLAFIEWLADRLNIDEDIKTRLVQSVLGAQPNTNGYDILLSQPIPVIAEVKCNLPINGGTVYGSAQRNGIEKDIVSLLQGKTKAAINCLECLKFMVFLDRQEIRKATEHFGRNLKEHKNKLVFVSEQTTLHRTDVVYIVYVAF